MTLENLGYFDEATHIIDISIEQFSSADRDILHNFCHGIITGFCVAKDIRDEDFWDSLALYVEEKFI